MRAVGHPVDVDCARRWGSPLKFLPFDRMEVVLVGVISNGVRLTRPE